MAQTFETETQSVNLDWATEATLLNLVRIISNMKSLTEQQKAELTKNAQKAASSATDTKTAISAMSNAVVNELNELAAELGNASRNSVTTGRDDSAFEDARSTMAKVTEEHSKNSIITRLNNSILSTFGPSVEDLGKKAGWTSLKVGNMGMLIGGLLIGTLGAVAKTFADQMTMYGELYKSGLLYKNAGDNVTSSMHGLFNAAETAKMPLADFSKTLKDYSKVINKDGVLKFAEMSRVVSQYGATFSMTASESAEYLAKYMEQQRIAGTLEQMTDEQIKQGSMQQLKATVDLARAMGTTVEALQKQRDGLVNNIDVQTALSAIPEQFRATSGAALETMYSALMESGQEELAGMFTKMVVLGDTAQKDAQVRQLATMGGAGSQMYQQLMATVQGFKSGVITQAQVQEELQKIGQSASALSDSMERNTGMVKLISDNGEYNLTTLMMQTKRAEQLTREKTVEEEKMAVANANIRNTMAVMGDIWNKIVGSIWNSPGLMKSIENALNSFSSVMDRSLPKITAAFQRLMNGITEERVEGMVNGLIKFTDYILKIVDWFNPNEVNDAKKGYESSFAELADSFLFQAFNVGVAMAAGWKVVTSIVGTLLTSGVSGIMSVITTAFSNVFSGFGSYIVNTFGNLFIGSISGFLSRLGLLGAAIASFVGVIKAIVNFDVTNILGSIGNIFLTAGEMVATTIYEQLYDVFTWIVDNIKAVGISLLSKVMSVFGDGEAVSFEQAMEDVKKEREYTETQDGFNRKMISERFERTREIMGIDTKEKSTEVTKAIEKQQTVTQVANQAQQQQPAEKVKQDERQKEKEKEKAKEEVKNKESKKMLEINSETKDIQKDIASMTSDLLSKIDRLVTVNENIMRALRASASGEK
jgi:hypothetical protein